MIRQPAQRSYRQLSRSVPTSVPAPIGGWNAREAEAAMPELDATVLENFFPSTSAVELRTGCANHVTGFSGDVLSLLPYTSPTQEKLFAATADGIYDASAPGTVGASAVTLNDGKVSSLNITTPGGSFLLAVNGVDNLCRFDGTSWLQYTTEITGVSTDTLSHLTLFKRRVWFIKKDSMSAYYLGLDSIAGAATEFPVGSIFARGGKLVSIASWSIDGGDGQDDYLVFITSAGEVAIYKGTDPSSISTFALVGVFFIGEPLTKNCFLKYGGDLLVLCQNGIYPLSKALLSSTVNRRSAVTDKISKAFSYAAANLPDTYGWGGAVWAAENALLINCPEPGDSIQFVMNTITGAWCKFSGWPASTFATFDGALYFGSHGAVVKAFTGESDFGANIVATAQQAYSYFGSRGQHKHFKLVRPVLKTNRPISIALTLNTDFETLTSSTIPAPPSNPVGVWDSSTWDTAIWAQSSYVDKRWQTVAAKLGYCAALRLRVESNAAKVAWSSTDFVYEKGGIL